MDNDIFAFPCAGGDLYGVQPAQGMTLRDWFAGQVLAGLCADHTCNTETWSEFAKVCYAAADAMLAERSK